MIGSLTAVNLRIVLTFVECHSVLSLFMLHKSRINDTKQLVCTLQVNTSGLQLVLGRVVRQSTVRIRAS